MNAFAAINFKQWIEEHRELLKPPVCNKVVWENREFIIMVVGGPNKRKDYHYNEGEEFFYQLEGDMLLKILVDGEFKDVPIREGEIFLLPPRVPHSPQRSADTVGLVVERKRTANELDALHWYCESCGDLLCREEFLLTNIVTQLPIVFDNYYSSEDRRTCAKCGSVMEPPAAWKK